MSRVPWLIRNLFKTDRADRELDEELRSYRELRVQERVAAGEGEEEASHAVDLDLGGLDRVKDAVRDTRTGVELERYWQDFRYAIRILGRSPGFTLAAVITLALGIGANTAIFSVIDTLLLRTLPVSDPQQLRVLSVRNVRGEASSFFSYPLFERLRSEQGSLSGLVAATNPDPIAVRIGGSQTTEEARVELVSGNYFQVLGVGAKLGRAFSYETDQSTAEAEVAVLSYGYWERRYNAQPDVIGSVLRIRNIAFTVIGVAQPGFSGNVVGESPEIWIPTSAQPLVLPGRDWIHATSTDWLQLMGRLRTEANERQAQASLQLIIDQLKAEPTFRRGMPEGARIVLASGSKGFSDLRERFGRPLVTLMLAVFFVLLIACVNVANLILARTAARQRELAIRLALGASHWRTIRLMLTENILLSCLGGTGGVLLALWSTKGLLPLIAERGSPPLAIHPDVRMFGFTFATSLLTALLFSIQPALKAGAHKDLRALKESATICGPRRARFGKALIVFQIALSMMLISGAALLSRSLLNLRRFDPGFARDHVLLMRIDPVSAGYEGSRTAVLNRRLLERVRAVPSVVSASLSGLPLMEGKNETCCIQVPGYVPARDERMAMRSLEVVPGYFATLGIRLLAGRDFTALDGGSNPVPVIVNVAFAKHYFGTVTAVGRLFQVDNRHQMEIVGVVQDARFDGIRLAAPRLVFFPAEGYKGTLLSLAVRTAGDPERAEASVRKAISLVDATLSIPETTTVESLIDDSLAQERLLAKLSSLFGMLALGIAAVGLYGLMAYNVSKRTNEFGLRMAVGASERQIKAMVMGDTATLLLIGSLLGLVASLAATQALTTFLFDLHATDPWMLALSFAVLFFVGLGAGWMPACRASGINPISALRHE